MKIVWPLKAFADHNSNVVQNIGLTINRLEHCGIRTKANYLNNDFKSLTSKCCGKCHCVEKERNNASFVLVICKILLIWSHPLRGPFSFIIEAKNSMECI